MGNNLETLPCLKTAFGVSFSLKSPFGSEGFETAPDTILAGRLLRTLAALNKGRLHLRLEGEEAAVWDAAGEKTWEETLLAGIEKKAEEDKAWAGIQSRTKSGVLGEIKTKERKGWLTPNLKYLKYALRSCPVGGDAFAKKVEEIQAELNQNVREWDAERKRKRIEVLSQDNKNGWTTQVSFERGASEPRDAGTPGVLEIRGEREPDLGADPWLIYLGPEEEPSRKTLEERCDEVATKLEILKETRRPTREEIEAVEAARETAETASEIGWLTLCRKWVEENTNGQQLPWNPRDARRDLDRLRNGQPCRHLGTRGLEKWLEEFRAESSEGRTLCRVVAGNYGNGKSHLLAAIRDEAANLGMPTCHYRMGMENRLWRGDLLKSEMVGGLDWDGGGLHGLITEASRRVEPKCPEWAAVAAAAKFSYPEEWELAMKTWLTANQRGCIGTTRFPAETRPKRSWLREEAEILWVSFHQWLAAANMRPVYLLDEAEAAAHVSQGQWRAQAADTLREIVDSAFDQSETENPQKNLYSLLVGITVTELERTLAVYPALRSRLHTPEENVSTKGTVWRVGPDPASLEKTKGIVLDLYKLGYPQKMELWETLGKAEGWPSLRGFDKSWRGRLKCLVTAFDQAMEETSEPKEWQAIETEDFEETQEEEETNPEEGGFEGLKSRRPKGPKHNKPEEGEDPATGKYHLEHLPTHRALAHYHNKMVEVKWADGPEWERLEPSGYLGHSRLPFAFGGENDETVIIPKTGWAENDETLKSICSAVFENEGAKNYRELRRVCYQAAEMAGLVAGQSAIERIAEAIATRNGWRKAETRRGVAFLDRDGIWTTIDGRFSKRLITPLKEESWEEPEGDWEGLILEELCRPQTPAEAEVQKEPRILRCYENPSLGDFLFGNG